MRMSHLFFGLATLSVSVLAAPTLQDHQADVLRRIHLTNQTEIKLGQLAEKKAQTQAAREYAARLVADHRNADKRVAEVAKSQQIDITLARPEIDRAQLAQEEHAMKKLDGVTGIRFDKKFADVMEDAHEETIAQLKDAKEKVLGTPTAGLIDELLPTLHQHERNAEMVEEKLD